MGLRAGEAAGLRLDDIDWRVGELTVHGKGNRHERLPLPPAVGEALAADASLEDIGQVLRHREARTTAIYAKVDYDRLRGLARPWMGDAA